MDYPIYVPSILDKIFLFRKEILHAYKLKKDTVLFICGAKDDCIYLKYSYPGNVQYHKIKIEDLDNYIELFTQAKQLINKKVVDHGE